MKTPGYEKEESDIRDDFNSISLLGKRKKKKNILSRLNVCHDVFYFFAEIIGNLFLAVSFFLQSRDLSQLGEILFEMAISFIKVHAFAKYS